MLLLSAIGGLALYRRKLNRKVAPIVMAVGLAILIGNDAAHAELLVEYNFDGGSTDSSGNGRDGSYDAGFDGTGGISGGTLNLSGAPFEGFAIPLEDSNPFDGSQDFTIDLSFSTTGCRWRGIDASQFGGLPRTGAR